MRSTLLQTYFKLHFFFQKVGRFRKGLLIPVSLQRKSHGHKNRATQDEVVKLVQSASKRVLMDLVVTRLPFGLQHRTEDVQVVVDREQDKESVKNIFTILAPWDS